MSNKDLGFMREKLTALNRQNKSKTYRQWELGAMDVKTLRKEYTRMRKEALRRLSILERNNVMDYLDNTPDITTAKGQSYEQVYSELTEINLFLKNPFSKISYVKTFENYMVELLNSQGYDNINLSNIREFNQYMKLIKESVGSAYYDPDRTVEIFNEAKRLRLDYSPEDLVKQHENLKLKLDAIREINPVKNNKPMTQRELRKRITLWAK